MKHIEKMNVYLANLSVWNVKLHNLHWNVTGMQFMPLHQFTEAMYDKTFAAYDDVAEHIKIKGFKPLVKVKDYLEVATIEELDYKDFTANEVLDYVGSDIELMRDFAVEIRNLADEESDFTAVGIFEDYIADFEKNLWFLRQIKG
ncbi:Dps family protein [Petrocella sp. FN5]|uniref:Dps family protein n=1 Tax=Petrocella sp. FN5 TaxID=3032002 RepID=UPI0023DACA90|nr:DNA starvation/stationary phase protection protein [Petrocella sp. FN5]MDF1617135.1 DNA starvation/stationary phase protection protein [Petrocella sp. FN5]